ncbi:FHA domain-containing protein [Halioxenophilus sp. WMMB6]|uniref:FHA domain-containing protein n=1 Tax=Halioxenophilus sp. WMMB6 TaxID=3073815 RepID=UPI00295E452E|nr:FHA domain-containing protein [Halioxenophilus sp. WMMB6]
MTILAQLVDDVVVNKFELTKPTTTIGRHPDSDVQINDAAISGQHAKIVLEQSKYLDGAIEIYLEDLNSKNGSFVNGLQVKGRQALGNNDIVRFGWNEFKLMDADPKSLEATALILQQTLS